VFRVPLAVAHAERPTSRLSVPKRYVEPDKRTRARILKEQVLKRERLSAITPEPLLDGPFAPAVAVPTSEVYGVERVFNGKKQSVHLGLDYRAPSGTPVLAVNAGRVLLARDLFYEGRCVAIDHGRGLVTLYLHFSRLDVKEGERVAKGRRLGLSGASGRVTGPHLHLAARWRGLYLDPASLLALPYDAPSSPEHVKE
jgi:murein DD-endopeptidase MepM/ murein hydrolase activator NlpD